MVFRDRAAYLPRSDALVVADLHVGRDATSNVEFPMGEREDLTERLGALLDRFEPSEVVAAGDLLHAFDSVPRGVADTLAAVRATVEDADAEFVAVRGNHDAMLSSVYDGTVHDAYRPGRGHTLVVHGHEPPDERPPGEHGRGRYVMGHDHPAIRVEGRRRPCYLLAHGAYRGADVLVLPAFNRLAAGVTVNGATAANMHSPMITDLDDYRPIVRDPEADQTLRFPPLGRFRDML
ncbi:metallophosphoesterase [Halobacteriales archaeon QS_8_69_26]|nr:MAG: metallophosphoesterase [Halobacteriales archaeon QS_8_69_26]